MKDADNSVSGLPEEATALVDVCLPEGSSGAGPEQRKRRKERKKKKVVEEEETKGAGGGAEEGGAGEGDAGDASETSGVVIDAEPRALSVKQRRKRLAKNRIKRRRLRLAKERKREAAKEEEERRRAEHIAYEQRRMQRRQAYLERQQQRQGHDEGGSGGAWEDARAHRGGRSWDAAPALADQGEGVDIDFRAAPDAVPAPAPAPKQQKQEQKQEQEQKAEEPKVVTSRSWDSLFAGKGKSEPAAPLFAKQGAQQGGFSFLGGASAFPDTLPSNIFTRDDFGGGNRNHSHGQQEEQEQEQEQEQMGDAQGEPERKKRKRQGIKGGSLFADLDQEFVLLLFNTFPPLCVCAQFSRLICVCVCLFWTVR